VRPRRASRLGAVDYIQGNINLYYVFISIRSHIRFAQIMSHQFKTGRVFVALNKQVKHIHLLIGVLLMLPYDY
jgi:hypothetical protein